jgi:hypothetical protein
MMLQLQQLLRLRLHLRQRGLLLLLQLPQRAAGGLVEPAPGSELV